MYRIWKAKAVHCVREKESHQSRQANSSLSTSVTNSNRTVVLQKCLSHDFSSNYGSNYLIKEVPLDTDGMKVMK